MQSNNGKWLAALVAAHLFACPVVAQAKPPASAPKAAITAVAAQKSVPTTGETVLVRYPRFAGSDLKACAKLNAAMQDHIKQANFYGDLVEWRCAKTFVAPGAVSAPVEIWRQGGAHRLHSFAPFNYQVRPQFKEMTLDDLFGQKADYKALSPVVRARLNADMLARDPESNPESRFEAGFPQADHFTGFAFDDKGVTFGLRLGSEATAGYHLRVPYSDLQGLFAPPSPVFKYANAAALPAKKVSGKAGFQRLAGDGKPTPDKEQFRQQILNGFCCVPNLSSGYRTTKLVNGYWKKTEGELVEDVTLTQPVFGLLDGKPVAAVHMVYWGGGSGHFGSILLYEQKDGQARTVGSYPCGDRVKILSMSFEGGRVKIVRKGGMTGPFRDEQTPKTILLKRSDFDVAECIGRELPRQLEDELRQMEGFFGKGSKLTDQEKKQAAEICNRHREDREEFSRLVALYLDECGWHAGPDPLRFDAAGNPSFYDEGKLSVELTSGEN